MGGFEFSNLLTNIVEGNALRMDWNDVVPKERLDYIMGNPPLDGYNWGHLKTWGFQTVLKRKIAASM